MRSTLSVLVLLLAACSSPAIKQGSAPPEAHAPLAVSPWSESFQPPRTLDTPRIHLEPLAPVHTELDFAALMGSREHLERTLGWGGWPPEDFTAGGDRDDLARHWAEFESREAYAYTVLASDRSTCVGCAYIVPLPGAEEHEAGLLYWVIESELANDLDRHLLESLLEWLQSEWLFSRIELPVHAENDRGHELARAIGFEPDAMGAEHPVPGRGALMRFAWMLPDQTVFVWRRPE